MIEGIIERETDKAILFRPHTVKDAVWIPRSIIPYLLRHGKGTSSVTLNIPEWKINQLGWTDLQN